jgi:acyl dehydratase
MMTLEEMNNSIGKDLGTSKWIEINQEQINTFAECTDDHQWIHVDEKMAKNGPFGTTIAHGFLTLSMLTALGSETAIIPEGIKMAMNYGFDKVRFLNPVKVGSKIRTKAVLKSVTDKGGGRILLSIGHTVEIEGEEKPALIADWLTMFFT